MIKKEEVWQLARPWEGEEDQQLLRWVGVYRKAGLTWERTFAKAAEKLGRSANACRARWNKISNLRSTSSVRRVSKSKSEEITEIALLMKRIEKLEASFEISKNQIRKLEGENRRLRGELKFLELLLIEKYHLLFSLLGEKSPRSRIHQV